MRRFIMASFGTVGDVAPMLAIGQALRELGDDVLFFGTPYYEDRYRASGIDYRLAGPLLDPDILLKDPRFTHPSRGVFNVFNFLYLPLVNILADTIGAELERRPADMILTQMWSFGGALAAEKAGLPYAVVSMAPITWYSAADPSLIGPFEPPPWLMGWLERHPIRWVINRTFSKSLGECAERLGLPAGNRRFYTIQEHSARNVGLWSTRFRTTAPDDFPQNRICGFPKPRQDTPPPALSPEAEAFLAAGDPPVVLGLGSALPRFVPEVYRMSWEACRRLGLRAVLVGGGEGVVERPDDRLLQLPWAPYASLFPRAGVVMHHGGIGSLAEALRAGRPQIIVPCGTDQYDNAARAERLGVACRIKRDDVTVRRLVEALSTCMQNSRMQSDAERLATRIGAEPDGALVAAEAVRSFVAGTQSGRMPQFT